MGGCGSNILQRLGPDFGKLVACEKGKELIDIKVKEFKETIYKQSNQIKNQTINGINTQQKNMLQKVRQTIADIDKQHPGTLDKAASTQRKTKESLLGADDIRAKFNQLRSATENQFVQEQNKISNEIQSIGEQTKRNVQSQRPSIPIYDQLPEAQKKKAFQEGQKRFADQIRSQQDQIQKQISSQFDINKYTQYLNGVQSSVNVEGITKQAEGLIATAKNGLSATSLFC